jgi:hypothetical protein
MLPGDAPSFFILRTQTPQNLVAVRYQLIKSIGGSICSGELVG